MYALAASAAGVGMLTAQQAEARIVYTQTHKVIGLNGSYKLDVNHDGIADFKIFDSYLYSVVYNINRLFVTPYRLNGVQETRNAAAADVQGARIGPNSFFLYRQAEMCSAATGNSHTRSYGPWLNVKNRYLGLRFKIKGKTHYGWARLTVTVDDIQIKAILTGYAYETIPNHSIRAGEIADGIDDPIPDPVSYSPQPATLGRLALGKK
jgi:hypothetical protein